MIYNIWTDCPKVPITDLLSFIVDNRGKTVPTADKGHILIATNCVTNETLYPVYEKVRYLSEETYQTWFRAHPIPGDILFVNKGTPGRVCMVPDPVDFCIAQDMIALRANDKKINNKYLFAILRSKRIQQQIYNTSVGDVIPHFKKQFLNQLLIPVPERKIQESIGNFYFNISYRIELNNRINRKLEKMAQAIFKDWFVDFEPFRGDEFVGSELGLIPKGWKVGLLSELVEVKYGKDHSKLGNGSIPVYGSGGVMRHADKSLYEKESVLIPRKGTLNNVIYINEPFWTVDTMFYTKMKRKNIAKYIYFFICSKDLNSMNAGSAVPSMTTDILNDIQILIAPDEIYTKFDNIVSPLFQMRTNNRYQSNSLAALRDSILPKQMSGEIEVQIRR